MNIHEHQAKQILKKYGAVVPEGVFALTVDDLLEKVKLLKTNKYVLKAQIHAGGRGKAGGVKILNTIEELATAAKELLGKTLITHQTGPEGREVKRLYVEESSNVDKEFYLSCLVDRASSKIAFISSDQGGVNIEEVARSSPEKIITTKVEMNNEISDKDCDEIIKIFDLNDNTRKQAISLIKSIYKQSKKLWHVSNAFIIPEQERLSKRITQKSFADFVFFQNSGLEATEAAIKIARKYFHNKGQKNKNSPKIFYLIFFPAFKTSCLLYTSPSPRD